MNIRSRAALVAEILLPENLEPIQGTAETVWPQARRYLEQPPKGSHAHL